LSEDEIPRLEAFAREYGTFLAGTFGVFDCHMVLS
jgi:hypothetical protein